jgi:hypothetical protein
MGLLLLKLDYFGSTFPVFGIEPQEWFRQLPPTSAEMLKGFPSYVRGSRVPEPGRSQP